MPQPEPRLVGAHVDIAPPLIDLSGDQLLQFDWGTRVFRAK